MALSQTQLILICIAIVHIGIAFSSPNKLLIMLIDGFRWDYFDKFGENQLPGFTAFKKRGVTADWLQPTFPSYSFVNYYSMMTGLYAEEHGQVHNEMWDEIHDSEFHTGDNRPEQDQPFWWDDGEPLWITARKQNKRSYFWYWNGCEVEIRGYRPNFCSPYQDTPNPNLEEFTKALWQAIGVLKNDSTDLAAVYWEQIDDWGHKEGPDGPNVIARILEVDKLLVELLEYLDQDTTLNNHLNVILFSDHGMQQVTPGNDSRINILDLITNADIKKAAGSKSGPVLLLWPADGKLNHVYEILKEVQHMTVYKKEDVPDRYHYQKHYRIPPLVLLADNGFALYRPNITDHIYLGYHGYDNSLENMRGIFMSMGPDFKEDYKRPGFVNVELYNMMCYIMGITPAPNNGTLSNVCDMLKDGCTLDAAPVNKHGILLSALSTITVYFLMLK